MELLSAYFSGFPLAAAVLLAVGIALLILEMFTPGFGVPGILGILSLLAAVVVRADTLENALLTLAIIVILLAVLAVIFFRSFSKGRISRSAIVLNDEITADATSLSEEDTRALLGKCGITETALRPSGIAVIEGRRLDVISSAEFVEKGKQVRVEKIDGIKILVKETENA